MPTDEELNRIAVCQMLRHALDVYLDLQMKVADTEELKSAMMSAQKLVRQLCDVLDRMDNPS